MYVCIFQIEKNTKAIVPQGSILGPLLYVLYTSDIREVAETTMAIFADDTTILSIGRTENEAKHKKTKTH